MTSQWELPFPRMMLNNQLHWYKGLSIIFIYYWSLVRMLLPWCLTEWRKTIIKTLIRAWWFWVPDWYSMIRVFSTRWPPVHTSLTMRAKKPGMHKDIFSRNSLTWVFSKKTFDQAFGPWTKIVRKCELSSPNFSKQTTVLSSVERISEIVVC